MSRRVQTQKEEHTYVDLGLPNQTIWVTPNNTPYEKGNYYAWGELEPKTDYSKENYKFYDVSTGGYTKYSAPDGIYTLQKEDDVASVLWGSKWRMPTEEQLLELRDICSFETIEIEGGVMIEETGSNNNVI